MKIEAQYKNTLVLLELHADYLRVMGNKIHAGKLVSSINAFLERSKLNCNLTTGKQMKIYINHSNPLEEISVTKYLESIKNGSKNLASGL